MAKISSSSSGTHHFIELPSLEEIEKIDQQRSKATESLEISDGHVRCQACGEMKAMIKNSGLIRTKSTSDRIYRLQICIKRAKSFGANTNSSEEQELKQILEGEKKRDFVRSLPLYSTSITGYRWVCSSCFDKAYWDMKNRKKDR